MSSSGKIRVPAEEYVIYYPPTDQSDSRITLNSSIITNKLLSDFVDIQGQIYKHQSLAHDTIVGQS